jgi:hypothetical protein
MPCQMAYDVLICEAYCPYGHPQGCKKHARLNVAGKPFAMQDYREQFNQLGFTGVKVELVADNKARKKPPGQAKTVNGATIYAARRFA